MNPSAKYAKDVKNNIDGLGDDAELRNVTNTWIRRSNLHGYTYNFSWLGRPIIQYPQDMIAMQELIWKIRPDLIIETGIAHGGSLVFYSSMLTMLDICDAAEADRSYDPRKSDRRVVGVDIDIRLHNRQAIEAHPMSTQIHMIQGSSIAQSIIDEVHRIASDHQRILVSLDSNHTHDHVLAELEAYAPLTSVGSYCVVFDTKIEEMPAEMFSDRPWGPGNNPWTAATEYLGKHPEFEVDRQIESKLLITVAPGGYLRRVR
jgi:cephalosporin hydroxylase